MKILFKPLAAQGACLLTIALLVSGFTLKAQGDISATHNFQPKALADTAGISSSSLRINTVLPADSDKVKLIFVNPSREKVRIELTLNDKKVLYSEYCTTATYIRNFNFTKAIPGKYMLTVRGKSLNYKRQIEVLYPSSKPVIKFTDTDPVLQVVELKK